MLSKQSSYPSIAELLPFWHPFKDTMVFDDGSLGIGFKLNGIDINLATAESINTTLLHIKNMLNSAHEGLSLQFFYRLTSNVDSIINKHKALSSDSNDTYKGIAQHRFDFLNKKNTDKLFFQPELYVFVRSQSHGLAKGGFFKSVKRYQRLSQTDFDQHYYAFERHIKQIESSLQHCNFKPIKLKNSEWFDMLYEHLNLDRLDKVQRAQYNTAGDFVSQLTLTDLHVSKDNVELGRLKFRTISLHTLPEGVSTASMVQSILKLPFHCWISHTIEIPTQKKEMEKMAVHRRLAHSMANGSNGVRDLESENKLNQIESLSKDLLEGTEKLVNCSMNVIIWGYTDQDLDLKCDEVLKAFTQMNQAQGVIETYAGLDAFMSNIPGICKTFRSKKVKSSNAAHMIPAFSAWQGNDKPVCLLSNQDNIPFSLNPFDSSLPNWNGLVFGGSGSGKSFTISQLMLQFYGQKPTPKIIWIDNGASSQKLIEVLGGEFINLTTDSDIYLNMFDLPKGHSVPSANKIKLILAVLENILVDKHQYGLPKRDKAQLEELIFKTYDEASVNTTPTLSDFKNQLLASDNPNMHAYAQTLYTWTGDTMYGKMLDGQSNVNIDKDLVTIEIKGLDAYEDLQNVFLLLFTDFIQSEASRELDRPYLLIVDEAWKLFETPSGLAFTLEAYRTFRKFNAGILAISQNYKDFLKNPSMADAILPNTISTFILKQRGIDWKDFQDKLLLNDTEIEAVKSLSMSKGHYSELMYVQDTRKSILRLSFDQLAYWICTTDPNDKQVIQTVKQQHPNKQTLEALTYIASEHFNNTNKKREHERK
ncbi:TraC family protein [bacterium]|nr:TraC family protein [bacterium]